MGPSKYKYIYGPVSSWRLGKSLGVDPISSEEKICSFDCVYCQAGRTAVLSSSRKVFVPVRALMEELRRLPPVALDFITFAGNGEPLLAKNLGEMIRAVKKTRSEKVAVITNASLINQKEVQKELAFADLVIAKLDASSEETLRVVNRPASGILFEEIVDGLQAFRKVFNGRLALQLMFVKSNQSRAAEIAKLAFLIEPDEIEINTPLRACDVKPLLPEEVEEIVRVFREICVNVPVLSVYETRRQKSAPFCQESTDHRRGKEIH